MRPSIRFEVFKRDGFICLYCGRHPPDVLLEVDHMVPICDGGGDDMTNLATSCWDCNRGKGGTSLSDIDTSRADATAVSEMQERVAQAKAYHALQQELVSLDNDQLDQVNETWCDAFGGVEVHDKPGVNWRCDAYFPENRSVRFFLKYMTLMEVLAAVHQTAGLLGHRTGRSPSLYFYKMCHNICRERRP